MTFEKWLQSRLTAHGFPCGLIDGKIGPVTIAALKAFETAKGLPADGVADPIVVEALRASSSTVPAGIAATLPARDFEVSVPAPAAAQVWPRQKDCLSFYGPVGESQVRVTLPFEMKLAWDKATRVRAMTLHSKVADSAERAFARIAATYSEKERAELGIDLFGGSLNVRRMRGGSAYSMHSWGIAIDFDPERNGLNVAAPKARLSHADALSFWQAWEAEGWLSLGRARNFDWMHVQAARL
ncbi:peptidoglycan-binding protein [Antarcticirhabdus aurantiaca]|uniref:Peptidoglycan-binding protein n=1 Tax=Antarcticirhabdus aurantiaca TaxID=2606717 RepID=A0ACD4NJA1_9HYPH|nr:peptidoglycan-binding protein [Jeongeuplla avenae]